MAKFKFRIVKGSLASSGGRADFLGVNDSGVIEAENRVDAFVKLYQQLSLSGDVTVIEHVDGQMTPLDFTKDELEAIANVGIHINLGYPKAGFQIEQIVAEA